MTGRGGGGNGVPRGRAGYRGRGGQRGRGGRDKGQRPVEERPDPSSTRSGPYIGAPARFCTTDPRLSLDHGSEARDELLARSRRDDFPLSAVRFEPNPSCNLITPGPPARSSSSLLLYERNFANPPPGYIRLPGPAKRQNSDTRWQHGVISACTVFHILEDLSRLTEDFPQRICISLKGFIESFGRIHTSDGLVVASEEDMEMLAYARETWIEHKGNDVSNDIFWVPGLEPIKDHEQGWKIRSMARLPEIPRSYFRAPWKAIDAQYRWGRAQLPRKGKRIAEKWIDGMGREREIWMTQCSSS